MLNSKPKNSFFRLAIVFPTRERMYCYYDEVSQTYGFSRSIDFADLFEIQQLLDIIASNLIANVRDGVNDVAYEVHYVYSIT